AGIPAGGLQVCVSPARTPARPEKDEFKAPTHAPMRKGAFYESWMCRADIPVRWFGRLSNLPKQKHGTRISACIYRGASTRTPRGGFGARAAAGRGGGRHFERRKSTDPKVPIGTTESSPRFQPWVASGEWPEPRRGDRKDGTGAVRSFVPDGTRFMFAAQPSDKSLGYFRASLRDLVSRHAKYVPATCRPEW